MLSQSELVARNKGPGIAKVQQPHYSFPQRALAYAVATVALAVLAALALVLPSPYGVICLVGLLGLCLATSIKTYQAYIKNRAQAEYEFAKGIKNKDPINSQKWLEKAAIERCYTPALLELAETTTDYNLKMTLINILQLRCHFRVVGRQKIDQLKAEASRLNTSS